MPTIGLSMIVKNGGEDLKLCLQSVDGLVEQIVIADTGSTDNTREIAQEFGATVLSIPWNDHFADARNAALEPMTTDWVLVLDADEALEVGSASALRSLIQSNKNVGGYLVPIQNFFRDAHVYLYGQLGNKNEDRSGRAKDAQSSAEHKLCRLFRRHPEIRYTGRIHEMVEHNIQALGLTISEAPFRILHYGQLAAPETRELKNHFYRKLGRIKVEEEPNNFLGWYELGSLEQVRFQNLDEALRCFHRATELVPDSTEAWVRIFQIHAERGENIEALAATERLGNAGDRDLAVLLKKSDILAEIGRLKEAQAAYGQALTLCSADSDALWAITNRLGFVEVRLNQFERGLQKLQLSTAKCPRYLEHHDKLMKAYIMTGNIRQAADVAQNTLAYFHSAALFLQAALLQGKIGETKKQKIILEAGVKRFPASTELAEALIACADTPLAN